MAELPFKLNAETVASNAHFSALKSFKLKLLKEWNFKSLEGISK